MKMQDTLVGLWVFISTVSLLAYQPAGILAETTEKPSKSIPTEVGDPRRSSKSWVPAYAGILVDLDGFDVLDLESDKESWVLSPESVEWLGLPVISVDYKCDGEFSEERVREATVAQAGNLYSRSAVKKSIENIYSLGDFSNVVVDAQSAGNGVLLTFKLTKKITTRNVRLEGNEKLEDEIVREVMKLKRQGQEYDESIAETDVESIRKLYESRGYFNADIDFLARVDNKSKQADVTFKISEGRQPLVGKIILIGTIEHRPESEAAIRTENLLKAMKEVKLGEVYKGQRALDSDVKLIEEKYRENGYVIAKVRRSQALSDPNAISVYDGKGKHFAAEDIQKPALRDGTVVIVIEIEQGRKVYIKIENNRHIKDAEIKRAIAVQRMHSVSEAVLRKSDEDIENLYKSKAYYLAKAEHEVLKDEVWDFDTDGNTEGWEPLDESTSLSVSGGTLKVSSSDGVPQIQISGRPPRTRGERGNQSSELRIDTSIYQKIQIRMRTNRGNTGRIQWLTDRDKSKWNKKKYLYFDLIPDNQLHNYSIDMRESKYWSDKVIKLRLTPVDLTGADLGSPSARKRDVGIAWIKVTTDSIPIVFRVTENEPMRIRNEVSIKAPPGKKMEIDPEKIRKQMLTRKKNPLSFWPLNRYLPKGIFDETEFQRDLRAILAFYKSEGYPNTRIDDYDIDTGKGDIDITIIISEGQKTVVTEVVLEGNREDILGNEEIRSHLPSFHEQNVAVKGSESSYVRYKIDPAKVFREDDIVADRSYLRSRYADEGYFATIEAIKKFNGEQTEVTIIYRIDEGKLISIDDEIEIRGNNRTERWVIERELSDKLTEDRIFSYTEVAESWQRLYDLGIFEGVKIDTKPIGGSEDLYRMTIDVTERKAVSVNLHAGFSSSEDFRGGLEYTHINLWGTGRRASAKAQVGTLGTRGQINYTEPRLLGTRALGLMDLYRFSERDYAETRTGGTVGISQKLYRVNTLTYRYRYDVVEYEEEGDEKIAKIGRIETTFHRDTRDNPLNPKKGWSHGLTLEYANPRLRGAETFARFTINNMYYSQLSQNIVLALGVRAGYAWGLSSTKGVLRPEQFNLSDYNTPRGYKWKTEHTDNMMLNLSMEIRFPVYKWMDAAVFFDSGGLYDEFSSLDIHSMYSSIGLGLRFITPIGPVRLDYGYPVRGDGNRNYLPHVAFGHAF